MVCWLFLISHVESGAVEYIISQLIKQYGKDKDLTVHIGKVN